MSNLIDPESNPGFTIPKDLEKTISHIYHAVVFYPLRDKKIKLDVCSDGRWRMTKGGRVVPNSEIENDDFLANISNILNSPLKSKSGMTLFVGQWFFLYTKDEEWRQAHGYYDCNKHVGRH